jgi:sigma-B regulation protein RsbU (phosphoserine phosphatase)
MSSVLASARVLYEACSEPGDLATRLNEMLHRSSDRKNFVTAFLGQLDPGSGTVRYVNAGHPPPFLLCDGSSRVLDSTGPPLGVVSGLPYAAEAVELAPGALLAVFSDGIPEAQKGDEFFEEARLGQLLAESSANSDLEAVSKRVIEQVDAFLGEAPRTDDITLMLLRRT